MKKREEVVENTVMENATEIFDDAAQVVEELNNEEVKEDVTADNVRTSDVIVGTVHSCAKLNVRKAPDVNSEVLVVINRDTKVFIHEMIESQGTKWYHIHTDIMENEETKTIEGFVMHDFIFVEAGE